MKGLTGQGPSPGRAGALDDHSEAQRSEEPRLRAYPGDERSVAA